MEDEKKSWWQRKRDRLIWILGGRCSECGATACLTFDCIVPRGDHHHKMNSRRRLGFYEAEMRNGNVQLLCSACNSAKGAKRGGKYRPSTLPPAPPKVVQNAGAVGLKNKIPTPTFANGSGRTFCGELALYLGHGFPK